MSCIFIRIKTYDNDDFNSNFDFINNDTYFSNTNDIHVDEKIKTSSESKNESNMDHIKEGRFKLIPLFPGLDMTYNQCQTIWEEIMIALGKFPG